MLARQVEAQAVAAVRDDPPGVVPPVPGERDSATPVPLAQKKRPHWVGVVVHDDGIETIGAPQSEGQHGCLLLTRADGREDPSEARSRDRRPLELERLGDCKSRGAASKEPEDEQGEGDAAQFAQRCRHSRFMRDGS